MDALASAEHHFEYFLGVDDDDDDVYDACTQPYSQEQQGNLTNTSPRVAAASSCDKVQTCSGDMLMAEVNDCDKSSWCKSMDAGSHAMTCTTSPQDSSSPPASDAKVPETQAVVCGGQSALPHERLPVKAEAHMDDDGHGVGVESSLHEVGDTGSAAEARNCSSRSRSKPMTRQTALGRIDRSIKELLLDRLSSTLAADNRERYRRVSTPTVCDITIMPRTKRSMIGHVLYKQ